MNLYIADLHFGHENIIKHDSRPFTNVAAMDRLLIELWNVRVQPEDTVYIIGDFCFKSAKPAEWYLRQLNGHKYLIIGNHDDKTLKNPEAMKLFDGVDKMMEIKDDGKHICMCHYPIIEWNSYYHGSWHIYGHIHNNRNESFDIMKKKDHALNAGCMINNYIPVSFAELVRNNEIFKNSSDI